MFFNFRFWLLVLQLWAAWKFWAPVWSTNGLQWKTTNLQSHLPFWPLFSWLIWLWLPKVEFTSTICSHLTTLFGLWYFLDFWHVWVLYFHMVENIWWKIYLICLKCLWPTTSIHICLFYSSQLFLSSSQ